MPEVQAAWELSSLPPPRPAALTGPGPHVPGRLWACDTEGGTHLPFGTGWAGRKQNPGKAQLNQSHSPCGTLTRRILQ